MKTKFDPFKNGSKPAALADELEHFAEKLATRSEGQTGKTHKIARDAAREALNKLAIARHEIERAAEDAAAAFRAGWHLREALETLGKWEVAIGKKLNPNKATAAAKLARAERGTRSKKEDLLKSAIQDAYEIFLEDPNTYQADKTKTYFAFNWLVGKCEEFEIVFDAWEGKDGLYRHRVSGDEVTPGTARRWVK